MENVKVNNQKLQKNQIAFSNYNVNLTNSGYVEKLSYNQLREIN